MKPNVLVLYPRAVLGGAERLVLDHLRFHDPSTCGLSVVALRRGTLDAEYHEFPNHLGLLAAARISPMALRRLSRLVGSHRIEVVHTHLQEADFYGYLLTRLHPRLAWISTRHNTDTFRTRPYWRLANGRMSRRTDRVVAVSNAVKDFVVRTERVDPERVSVVPNGVDVGRFRPGSAPPGLRASLGVGEDAFVIGIAGRITAQKGHAALLEAVALVAGAAPGLRVLIAGEGALERRLRRLARRLGIADRVAFAGFRPDMPDVYRAIDAYCMPSQFEGFGLVFVEAMLSERLVIGTRVDGISEIVDDEVTGLLVEPGNVESLSVALLRAYRREHDPQIPVRARAKALAQFDVETNVRRIEEIYVSLCQSDRPSRPGGMATSSASRMVGNTSAVRRGPAASG